MQTNLEDGKSHKYFVIDCKKMNRADFTAAKVTSAIFLTHSHIVVVVHRCFGIRPEAGGEKDYFSWIRAFSGHYYHGILQGLCVREDRGGID